MGQAAEKLIDLNDICSDLSQKLYDYDASRIKVYPHPNNRASDAGHDCARFLVYSRLNWKEKLRHDVGLQRVFDEGNIQEKAVLDKFSAAGIRVVEQQRSFEWREMQLTGHIDGMIEYAGHTIPTEIKSFSTGNYGAINTIDDMIKSKHFYMRRYPAQLALYMLMSEIPFSMFVLKEKQSGAIKFVPCELNYEYAEGILKKLETVNTHIAEGTYPERINNMSVCESCDFRHLCLPEQNFNAAEFVNDQDFIDMLYRREQLKDMAKEFESIDKDIKDRVKTAEADVIAGEFVLKRKHIIKNVPAKEASTQDFWTTTIVKLK
jgi:CRISPR/Cas system-associated exonuclease Cas4 (RecB family)